MSEGNAIGVVLEAGADLSASTIGNNTTGISTQNGGGSVTQTSIVGNDVGIRMYALAALGDCTVGPNATYDVEVLTPVVPFTTVDMRNCRWSAATTQEMIAGGLFANVTSIWDWWEDNSRSLVDYSGFLAPVAVAPQTWGKMKAAFR